MKGFSDLSKMRLTILDCSQLHWLYLVKISSRPIIKASHSCWMGTYFLPRFQLLEHPVIYHAGVHCNNSLSILVPRWYLKLRLSIDTISWISNTPFPCPFLLNVTTVVCLKHPIAMVQSNSLPLRAAADCFDNISSFVHGMLMLSSFGG